jgi:hypothetical protein
MIFMGKKSKFRSSQEIKSDLDTFMVMRPMSRVHNNGSPQKTKEIKKETIKRNENQGV